MNESEVAQLCPTLCDPVDCSLPGSSLHGILQARIVEWVTISFSKASSQPRDRTRVSHIIGGHFNLWAKSKSPHGEKAIGIWELAVSSQSNTAERGWLWVMW